MDNPSWIFVLATVISVLGVAIVYKQFAFSAERKAQNENDRSSIQKDLAKFFIKVSIIEMIPIILVVYGFMKLDSFQSTFSNPEIYVPLGIVILFYLLGFMMISSTTSQIQLIPNINENIKRSFQQYKQIGIGIISAFPIISVVAITVMGLAG